MSIALSTEMGIAANMTTRTIRRAAPRALSLALSARGAMTGMKGGTAPTKSADGFDNVWHLAQP
jgi:hypothetical protein